MISNELDPARVRDISPYVLDSAGRVRVLPSEFWASTTIEERALFGHRYGIYNFPTVELVDFLRDYIGDRRAIEIGAGHGVLAQALDIRATDNCMQRKAKYRRIYRATGQPTVPYGRNVIEIDAHDAVRRYDPDVVIGCWITHRYDPGRHYAGGNEIGVDEADVIRHCLQYIMIGNTAVHALKPIWELPHIISYPSFVFSRSANGSPDFLAVWGRGNL